MGIAESAVDREIVYFCKLYGFKTWRNQVIKGWYRPRKGVREYWITQGTPGLADRSILLNDGKTLYVETKRPSGGMQSQTQKDFESDCVIRNVPYIIARSWNDVSKFLIENKYLTEEV